MGALLCQTGCPPSATPRSLRTLTVLRHDGALLRNFDVSVRCGPQRWRRTRTDMRGELRLSAPRSGTSRACEVRVGKLPGSIRSDSRVFLPPFAVRVQLRYEGAFCRGRIILDERHAGRKATVCGVDVSLVNAQLSIGGDVWRGLRQGMRIYHQQGANLWLSPKESPVRITKRQIKALTRQAAKDRACASGCQKSVAALASALETAEILQRTGRLLVGRSPRRTAEQAAHLYGRFKHALRRALERHRPPPCCTAARNIVALMRRLLSSVDRRSLQLSVERVDIVRVASRDVSQTPRPSDRLSAPIWIEGTVTSLRGSLTGQSLVLGGACPRLTPAVIASFYSVRPKNCKPTLVVATEPGRCVERAWKHSLRIGVLERYGRWAFGLYRDSSLTLITLGRTGREIRRVAVGPEGIVADHLKAACQPPAATRSAAARAHFIGKIWRLMRRGCWAEAEASAKSKLPVSKERGRVLRALIEALARQGKQAEATRYLGFWRKRAGAAAAKQLALQIKLWAKTTRSRQAKTAQPHPCRD